MITWQLHGGGLTASHLFPGQLLRTLLLVFAEELEYLEFVFFSLQHPTVSPGWKVDSL